MTVNECRSEMGGIAAVDWSASGNGEKLVKGKNRKRFMRLRTKFVIVTIFILVLTLSLCCFFLVKICKKTIMQDAVTYTVQENMQLANLMMDKTAKMYSISSKRVQKAGIRYYFSDFAANAAQGSEYVLTGAEETLYNNSGVDIQEILSHADSFYQKTDHQEIPYEVVRVDGKDYCVSGLEMEILEELYTVGIVRDITERMDMVRTFTVRCVLICSVIFSAAVFLMLLFLAKTWKPIEILNENAQRIAHGDYTGRISLERRDELGVLADSFNSMAESVEQHIREVEAAAEEQNMLLHALAHEMRTPVTAISGYSYALRNARLSTEQKEEAVSFIESESLRLERLNTKITELVRMNGTELAKEKIMVTELFDRLAMVLRLSRGKQSADAGVFDPETDFALREGEGQILSAIAFSYEEQTDINGDIDLLLMLLTNLIDNAKKAGADQIVVSCKDGVLSVSDNGTGIPAEQIEKIMQPFYQGDVSRNREGFGLGLALCQKIAQLHATNLRVESIVGQGSRFSVKL